MADKLSPALASSFTAFGNIVPYVSRKTGLFSLTDSKSCRDKGLKPGCLPTCDQAILNISSGRPLWCVALDDWIENTSSTTRCDYIVYDDETSPLKLALCELTCTQENYVNPFRSNPGKRAKAINQITTAWTFLSSKPSVKNEFDNYSEIIGIFGWRDPINISLYGSRPATTPAGSMARFLRTPSSTSTGITYLGTTFGSAYKIYQVKYSSTYLW